MSAPRSRIRPAEGVTKPAIIRRMVVLPQPDGPTSDNNSPFSTLSETGPIVVAAPNDFSSDWSSTSITPAALATAATGTAPWRLPRSAQAGLRRHRWLGPRQAGLPHRSSPAALAPADRRGISP